MVFHLHLHGLLFLNWKAHRVLPSRSDLGIEGNNYPRTVPVAANMGQERDAGSGPLDFARDDMRDCNSPFYFVYYLWGDRSACCPALLLPHVPVDGGTSLLKRSGRCSAVVFGSSTPWR